MPSQIKGPGIFLAQFAGDAAPFNTLEGITKWAASQGYKGVQIPTFDARLFDLTKAAESETYCDEVKGICADAGGRDGGVASCRMRLQFRAGTDCRGFAG